MTFPAFQTQNSKVINTSLNDDEKYGTFPTNLKKNFDSKLLNITSNFCPEPTVYNKVINFKAIKVTDNRDGKTQTNDLPTLVHLNNIVYNQNTDTDTNISIPSEKNIINVYNSVDNYFLAFEQSNIGRSLITNKKINSKYPDTTKDASYLSLDSNFNAESDNKINPSVLIDRAFNPWLLQCFRYIDERSIEIFVDFFRDIRTYNEFFIC